ncbi:hypothetical protein KPH14_007068 [Odynerus spinipes]|uniref:Glutathione S-transferase n=1 Tax=Odynerus spinipes TaxID=1348599 RepID=A0AAD9RRR8_9HYME|nr:hypothetical protein KPH14_007068 [Odynerus spinipes]
MIPSRSHSRRRSNESLLVKITVIRLVNPRVNKIDNGVNYETYNKEEKCRRSYCTANCQDQLKEDFVKINPQHTIPTIQDNDFVLWDSNAIVTYLVDKYASDDNLYPKDLQLRATINQRLIYNAAVLFTNLRNICRPILLGMEKTVPKEKIEQLENAIEIFDKLLEGKQWLVGDSYTLADICSVTTISSLTTVLQLEKYPNVHAWVKRCEEQLPGYEKYNEPGNKELVDTFHQKVESS